MRSRSIECLLGLIYLLRTCVGRVFACCGNDLILEQKLNFTTYSFWKGTQLFKFLLKWNFQIIAYYLPIPIPIPMNKTDM